MHVKVGIVLEHVVSGALDALLADGNYDDAIELNSRLTDVDSSEAAIQEVLKFVEFDIE
ncbi:hypothetical protein [Desulfovibrio sp. TomC]|uniref:hypothetical protein n=1 Tax=Desulfovibrio sp. TomC TaxID=1562888 RepID=UPI001E444F11|nr:hypothetical protein [Desulfovibrio sp. TomC]